VTRAPFVVHCCHCRWCQRQTGTAFALNALIEAPHIEITKGEVEETVVASPSGKGQTIARCPHCKIAVWSNYFMGGIEKGIRFLRVGTLDNPDLLPPDVHIFTATKQPWVQLPEGDRVVDTFYDYAEVWSEEDNAWRLEQLEALKSD
jgi:hypothetical protein